MTWLERGKQAPVSQHEADCKSMNRHRFPAPEKFDDAVNGDFAWTKPDIRAVNAILNRPRTGTDAVNGLSGALNVWFPAVNVVFKRLKETTTP